MMKHTDLHFRYLFRLISSSAILYTEMIMADEIVNNQMEKEKLSEILHFYQPNTKSKGLTILQIGGNNPTIIQKACSLALPYNYDGINLNVGCPSAIVAGDNEMGVALMKKEKLVKQICEAMLESTSNSDLTHGVSVKCRIGVDDYDSYENLANFISTVGSSGVKRFQIHARKALLGLDPKTNRRFAPLDYERVYKLVQDFPDYEFILNGGIDSLESVSTHLDKCHGIMVGRACVNHPYLWSKVDSLLGYEDQKLSRGEILDKYIEYCKNYENNIRSILKTKSEKLNLVAALTAPVYNLFCGEEGNEKYQRVLKRATHQVTSAVTAINAAKLHISQNVLSSLSAQPLSLQVVYEKAPSKSGPRNRRIV
jgi:tRNA-dihydrouridine synthase A